MNDIGQLSNSTDKHRRLLKTQNTWNWKDAQSVWHASTQVQNLYTYDLLSMKLTNNITSSDGTNRTENYTYDELNRLKTVNYGDGQTQGYSFDAMGNRTQKQDSTSGTENYSYNAANMLLSRAGNSYTNDVNGNTLTGGGRTNTWDSENRMVSCVNGTNTSSFTYGADGQRRRSTVNTVSTDFVLDANMFIRERRNSINIATYLVGGRGPEYRRDDTSGSVRWYLYDGLGSVLGEVDPSGNVTSSRKYDVYGLVRGGNNPGGTSSHKFVGKLGHPSEDNTGLVYMRARYYDPTVGRFASEDPACRGLNWFAYCSGNPTCFRDRSGKEGEGGVGGQVCVMEATESIDLALNCCLEGAMKAGLIEAGTTLEGVAGMIGTGSPSAEAGYTLAVLSETSGISVGEWVYMCKYVANAGGTIFKAWIGYNARLAVAFAMGEDIFEHCTPSLGTNTGDISWWAK